MDYLLMSAELSLVSLLAIACFRSAPARWRLCVSLAALPVATLPWSMLPPIEIVRAEITPLVLEALPVLGSKDTVEVATPSGATSVAARLPWLAVLAAATVIGFVGFVVQSARHREAVKRWAVRAHDGSYLLARLPEDWRAACRVRVVPESDIAVATGFLRPTVWLGERHLAHRALSTVLVHELVHVRRQHTRLATAVTLLRCLLWWHPFAWVWSWIVGREVEHDCDEACVRLFGKEPYRNTLASLTRRATRQRAALGLTGHTSFNVRRLQVLERVHSIRARHGIAGAAWACAFAALVVDVTVVAEGTHEGTNERSPGGEHREVTLSQDESGWWQISRGEDRRHLIRLAPNTTIRWLPARAPVKGQKSILAIAGRERPGSDRGGADRPQLPPGLDGANRRASPSLELSCSSDLETADATVNFHSPWMKVAPDDAKGRDGSVLEIRSLTGSSVFYRKPLHDGTTATVEYRFDSESGRIAEVPLASRVDSSAIGDWQSRFTLDAQAVLRIGATTQRPGELTLTVSNPTNGYRTGKISFDLASKRAEIDEFLRRCEGFRRAAAA
ncbi:MAG: M56 family metallopeptidase [Gammaproteobacteria bacterium]|nr:M56 family metallopeptidase [Gammaproteobacteria bacterium]